MILVSYDTLSLWTFTATVISAIIVAVSTIIVAASTLCVSIIRIIAAGG